MPHLEHTERDAQSDPAATWSEDDEGDQRFDVDVDARTLRGRTLMRMVRSTQRPTGTPMSTPIAAATAAIAEPPVSSKTLPATTVALTGIARK
jgi:hypothetical protein